MCGTAIAGVGGRPMLDLGSYASMDTATNPTPSASAITQHGGCAIPGLDETVTGSGNVVNQNGTNFNCHGRAAGGDAAAGSTRHGRAR
ncbi:MAG: hypothetical protein ACJ734_10855 [Gaiellaceae bacterium]